MLPVQRGESVVLDNLQREPLLVSVAGYTFRAEAVPAMPAPRGAHVQPARRS